jgi:capsular exopolysaccharide synthesis family protein
MIMTSGNGRVADHTATKDLVRFVGRNPWLVVGVPVLMIVATAMFVSWIPPVYQGMATARIDQERSNIAVLDALQELSSGASIYTEIAELRSRSLAEEVVDTLDLNLTVEAPRRTPRTGLFAALDVSRDAHAGRYTLSHIEGPRFRLADEKGNSREVLAGQPFNVEGATLTLANDAGASNSIRFQIQPFQSAVRKLQKDLNVARPDREADIINIRYESTDRELASEVPNTAARLFIQRRQAVKSQQARSTVAFLNEQLDTLGQQLRGFEGGLQNFRESQGIVSLDAQGEAQVGRLAEFQANRDVTAAERSSLAKLMAEIDRTQAQPNEPSPYRRLIGFPSILAQGAATEVLRSLNEVENQRADLLTRRTAGDPDVVILTRRIEQMEDQLHSMVATYLQGLDNRIASFDGVLTRFSNDLRRIPAKEIQLARLMRQAKVTEDIFTTLQSRMKEAQIVAAVQDPSVRIIDPAIIPMKPVRPNKPMDFVLALILGLALGGSIAFVKENLDTTIHTRDELQVESGMVPILGLIPRIREVGAATNGARRTLWPLRSAAIPTTAEAIRSRLVAGRNSRGSASEAYRTLRTNLVFSRPEQPPKTVVFTSPAPGDGKSTSSSNLVITLAQQGIRCILIDADMRRGAMHTAFDTTAQPGLSNYLLGGPSIEDVTRHVQIDDAVFDFIPTGILPPNPAELLASPRMQALLEHLAGQYDTVIFDAPPLNIVTDAAILGASTDGVVLVVRAGVTDRAAVRFAFEQLNAVRARVLGCILNDIDVKRDTYYGSKLAGGYYEVHS